MQDKLFYLEMSWVCEETEGKHQLVPRELVTEAEELAKKALKVLMHLCIQCVHITDFVFFFFAN